MAEYTAERTNTSDLYRAMSIPSTREAISLSWMARNARPEGLLIKLTASQQPTTRVAPDIQYQVEGPTARQPNSTSRGTCIPFGPPVSSDWLLKNIQINRPKPSVATAR